jgi:hypothetical protein
MANSMPIGSMYAINGNIYHPYTPNVSIYTIHGSYGFVEPPICWNNFLSLAGFALPLSRPEQKIRAAAVGGFCGSGSWKSADGYMVGKNL